MDTTNIKSLAPVGLQLNALQLQLRPVHPTAARSVPARLAEVAGITFSRPFKGTYHSDEYEQWQQQHQQQQQREL
jgi:hypothetical protein